VDRAGREATAAGRSAALWAAQRRPQASGRLNMGQSCGNRQRSPSRLRNSRGGPGKIAEPHRPLCRLCAGNAWPPIAPKPISERVSSVRQSRIGIRIRTDDRDSADGQKSPLSPASSRPLSEQSCPATRKSDINRNDHAHDGISGDASSPSRQRRKASHLHRR
jgi:hypothetical protein